MFMMMVIQIIARYFFTNIPPGWLEELASQFMTIFIFIGMAVGVRDKIHITLTIIVDSMAKKIKLPTEIMGKILTMTLGIMMSINMRPLFTILKYNRLPGTRIPVVIIYAFPAAVGILMALIAVYQIYDHFKSGTDEEQTRPEDFIN
jgi:TRAP-type C4-dicarboxylate transport system permease small subunit